jgi:hypothetical protein
MLKKGPAMSREEVGQVCLKACLASSHYMSMMHAVEAKKIPERYLGH